MDMYLGHPGNGLYNREYHPSWPQVSPASTDYPLLAKGVLIGSLSSTLLLLTAPAENLRHVTFCYIPYLIQNPICSLPVEPSTSALLLLLRIDDGTLATA